MRPSQRASTNQSAKIASATVLMRGALGPLRCFIALGVFLGLNTGCHSSIDGPKPSIVFVRVPPVGVGAGPETFDRISGKVDSPPNGTRITLYALNKSTWYVQPFRSHSLTDVGKDGSWTSATHLGTEYAALLVAPGFNPPAKLKALPTPDANVLAVASVKGEPVGLTPSQVVHFSGYDWKVRSSPADHGGQVCNYQPSNAWVDAKGDLHLLIKQEGGVWTCAGISLTRSLGYGTYRLLVSDSTHLPPSAAFTMFTRADHVDVDERTGFSVDLSEWGNPRRGNANFVLQPYYIPGNTAHFKVPAGKATYDVRWDPGIATFSAFVGDDVKMRARLIDHVFRSGVPIPGTETVHLDLYDFHHPVSGNTDPVEIVVQKFEYLP